MRIRICIIFLIALNACKLNNDSRTASTKEMADELSTIAEKAKVSGTYPYFTDGLIKKLKSGLVGLPYTIRQGNWLDYMLMLVLKGDNEECIRLIDEYYRATGGEEVNPQSIAFHKIRALALLRKGEVENCINNHSGQSCIMPIKGDGVHQILEPVQQAIIEYEQLLKYDPNDLQSKWFLNLCHQAIGTYPKKVPIEFLIPQEVFESEVDFPVFKNISMELGVAVNNHAGGASVEDFNNDGLLDIFTTSYSLGEQSHLFINDGQGGFMDQTEAYGLIGMVGGLNNIHADFNNDGLTDIYIMRGAWLAQNGQIPNSLLINQNGSFSDKTKVAGLYAKAPTGSIAAADVNLDGHLDLFVGNESRRGSKNPSQLYINQGDGTFKDWAPQLGLEINQFIKGAVWGDVNNDRLPDLYLSIYGGKNLLYINRGGTDMANWSFEEVSIKAGVNEPIMSFTTWFWDYNQDGYQDIMVFGYDNNYPHLIASEVTKDYMGEPFEGEKPRLYKNNGDETFTDVSKQVGLEKLLYVMGGNYGDLNNDGYPDFYLGTGEFNIWASVPNRAFLNVGGNKFADVTTAGEFGQIQKGHGVAFGDVDNDGDQDIYHQVGGAAESDVFQNMLFQNPGFQNNWLTLKLEGTTSNRSAIGAKIEVQIILPSGEQRKVYHYVGTGGSFGANALRAEIGLADAKNVVQVIIEWPDIEKTRQVIKNIEINHSYRIKQGVEPQIQNLNSIELNSETTHVHHH
ncbi:MAG: CRTAC1 family protein [Reichenbachiella sp.]|uniref:CRTAC1 family protein n=1 Tax=Reichenbachiella sp. TaxID=2184521 RepID=UPI003297CF31